MQQIQAIKPTGPAKTSAKRDAILEAAVELFLEVGYGAASINTLIAHVGGSKATVYAHFENKERLFEAVVDEVLSEVSTAMSGIDLAGFGLRDGLQYVGEHLLHLVTSKRHIDLARLVIAEAQRFPEIGRIYYDHGPALAYKGLSVFLLEHSNGEGSFRVTDEDTAAAWFASMLIHRSFLERLCIGTEPPSSRQIEVKVEAVVTAFLDMYRLRATMKSEGGYPCD
ncbi:MAG: TetR/AcrR family transcriptional regulator [Proteobacteria bacterium]|nr:TetR/AcrR family transcriptional regulator [Pseudomonadota bacterium]